MRTATHFDTHQFQKPKFQWAIGAKTGLEFVDFAFHGMHMQFKAQASKHGPPPVWAMDNAALHLLVARFLENRAAIGPIDASIPERIARAEEELKARRPVINDRLDRLAHRYVELKRAGGDAKKLRRLEILIQGLDMQLVVLDKSPAAMVTAIVYLSYRAMADSVGVAQQLGLTPTMVRVILHRLKCLWERFQRPDYVPFTQHRNAEIARANLVVAPGCKFGRLTVVHSTNDDLVPVEIICRLEPRSLVRQRLGRRILDAWVADKVLLHTRWHAAYIHKRDLPHSPKYPAWRCLCECGRSVEASGTNLQHKITKSCGCDKNQKG
jgi:hypothetical protein